MLEIGSRRRSLPAPPHVVWRSLTDPHEPGARPWLALRPDESEPEVLEAQDDRLVVWSSLWARRPDDRIVLDLALLGSGTDLRWTLLTPDGRPDGLPDDGTTGHLRHRLNHLLFADLRFSYGQ